MKDQSSKGLTKSPKLKSTRKVIRFVESIEDQHKDEIKEVFDLFDHKESGTMLAKDLQISLNTLGFELDKEDVVNLLSEFDKTLESVIKFDEFYEIANQKFLEKDPDDEIKNSFELIGNKNNKITAESLRDAFRSVGESMTDDEIREMIRIVGNEEEITIEDFVNFMKNPVHYNKNN
jgi:Ca2+-binding EF-hand superfamily protein